ncbi:MAG: hypothetical protein R6U19_00255, partial [Bacteroidales bacterium]
MIVQDSTTLRQETFFVQFLSQEAEFKAVNPFTPDNDVRESVFREHALQVSDPEMPVIPLEQGFQAPSWLLMVFMIQLVLIGIVLTAYRNLFHLQLSATYSKTNLYQLIKEGSPVYQIYTLLLLLVYILSMSTAAYISIRRYLPAITLPD